MSAAGFEDRVDLRAVLGDLPGTGEACGDHEGVPGTEAHALAAATFDDNPARSHHAQLILGVTHAPFAARGRPSPGKELLTRVAEVVAHLQFRRPGDQPFRW